VAKKILLAVSIVIVGTTTAVVVAPLFFRRPDPGNLARPGQANGPSAPVKLDWDLSIRQDVSAVGWPLGMKETAWQLDGPGVLRIKLPDGREGTFAFVGIEVRQEAGRVRNIRVFAPAEQLDGARVRARDLLNRWGLDGHESLDAWYEKRRRDGMGYRDPDGQNWLTKPGAGDPFPRYGVAVLTTHRSEEPWCVEWAVILFKPAGTPLRPRD
jgi:hypothetical protein